LTGKNLLALAFRVVGLTFGVIAVVVAVFTVVFVLRSESTFGVVVDHSSIQNQITVMPQADQSGILFYPVIAYTTRNGTEATFTGPRGRSSPQFQVGERVSVLISGSSPGDARLNSVLGVWGTAIILGGLAAIFFVLSFAAPLGFGGIRE
jgi:Protein of unknown function (DUF3592)